MNKLLAKLTYMFLGLTSIIFLLFLIIVPSYASTTIILNGESNLSIKVNSRLQDPGYVGLINEKDATNRVIVKNNVDVTKPGIYKIEYILTNKRGQNKKIKTRTVIVRGESIPTLKLKGKEIINHTINNPYNEEGYIASDKIDGDISKNVIVKSNLDVNKKGTYTITYSIINSSYNDVTITRTINVDDFEPPKLTLIGNQTIYINKDTKYSDQGAKANDNIDGNLTSKIKKEYNFNTSIVGKYYVTYSVIDSNNNKSSLNRIIYVIDLNNSTYIKISISEQKLRYYKNNKLFLESDVVTGKNNATRTGNFSILKKVRDTDLTGSDYVSHVNYWLAYYKNIQGIHDASWRSSFGGKIYLTNGSHGCVNMPYKNVKILYENVTIGTKVIIK